MHVGVLVPRESDVANSTRIASLDQRGVGPLLVKDPVRVLVPENLVVLDEVDAIDPEPPERFFQLAGRLLLRTAIDLRHEKGLLAVAVAQGLSHADLARPFVVVPAVVEEVDAAVQGRAHDPDGQPLIDVAQAQMPTADADGGYFLSRRSEIPINHADESSTPRVDSAAPGKVGWVM